MNRQGPAFRHVRHPFDPIYDENSQILILGTIPSPKTLETGFYYGHPQNRFWKVLAALFSEPVPTDADQKTFFLLRRHIALWDVLKSCAMQGARDDTIESPVLQDIPSLLKKTGIRRIYANGNKAGDLYRRCAYPETGIEATVLPSTSPMNASYSLERLVKHWEIILNALDV